MSVLDTNAVLRFLLRDNEEIAVFVRDRMKKETCLLPVEVVAEAVYVLAKVYKIERDRVCRSLSDFINKENIDVTSHEIMETALRIYGETTFDFVDCLMVGYARIEGHRIITFDKKLEKYLQQNSHADP